MLQVSLSLGSTPCTSGSTSGTQISPPQQLGPDLLRDSPQWPLSVPQSSLREARRRPRGACSLAAAACTAGQSLAQPSLCADELAGEEQPGAQGALLPVPKLARRSSELQPPVGARAQVGLVRCSY